MLFRSSIVNVESDRPFGGLAGSVAGLSANQIENCYTAGKLNGNQMLGAGFAFVDGDSVPSDAIKNVLCEKGMAEKTVAEGSVDGAKFVSEEILKNGAEQLGEAFKNDYLNENEGYPVFVNEGEKLGLAKNKAKVELNNYLKNKYSPSDQQKVNGIVAEAINRIDNAETVEQVKAILKKAKEELEDRKSTRLNSSHGS